MSKFLWVLLVVAILVGGVLMPSTLASAHDAGQQIEQWGYTVVRVPVYSATYSASGHTLKLSFEGRTCPSLVWSNMYDGILRGYNIAGPCGIDRYRVRIVPSSPVDSNP